MSPDLLPFRLRAAGRASPRQGGRRRKDREAERQRLREETERELDALFAEFGWKALPGAPIALIYARYSTEFQHSVVDQVRACLEEAIRLGLAVARDHVFYDLGVSGYKERRPGLDKIRAALAARRPRVLLVLTTNRLYRKMYKCMKFVEELVVGKGHRSVFVRTGIDTAQGELWRLPLQVHTMTDEISGNMYAPNVRAAHEGMFEKGWVVTGIPYGYHGVEVPGPLTKRGRPRRAIAVEPSEAEWVVKIYRWFVNDRLPMARILEFLNDQGAPLPPMSESGFWTHDALRYLLANPVYRGWWEYGKGKNVWVPEDYIKRILRDKPLKHKQFEDRRLVSDEDWYAAQRLLEAFRGRGGRKPKDGNRTTRPRVLNGLLRCKVHDRPLKVCGDFGQWMCCPICMTLPRATRPLITYLNRMQATRQVCAAIAARIRSDAALVPAIIRACQDAATAAGAAEPNRAAALRDRVDRLTRQIQFVLSHAGDTDEDRKESGEQIRALRADRAAAAAELAALEAAAARPTPVPSEEDVTALLSGLAEELTRTAAGSDPADAGTARAVLELVTGGRIEVEQAGERRKCRGWLVGRFVPRLLKAALARLPEGGPAAPSDGGDEVVVEFKEETIPGKLADRVKEMADRGMLLSAIANELGVDRHHVTAAWRVWYERRGLPAPPDGRVRRATVPDKIRKEPVFRRIADEVKRLYDEGLLAYEIADRVGVTRDTVRAALDYWFRARGQVMPDGRGRRKGLKRKGRNRREGGRSCEIDDRE
jgi:DNA invertase Pin-like site-specific DNA recombinase